MLLCSDMALVFGDPLHLFLFLVGISFIHTHILSHFCLGVPFTLRNLLILQDKSMTPATQDPDRLQVSDVK